MKNKGTLWLFVVVVALGAYAYFGDYKKEINETKAKELQSTLVTDKAEQINIIILQTKKEKIVIKRSTDGWSLEQPIQDQADNDEIEGLVAGLGLEKYIDVAREGDSINWAEYGLDQPEGTLTLQTQSGDTHQFEISAKKNFEGHPLLRKDHDQKVLVVSQNWSQLAKKTAFDFRRKSLARFQAAAIDQFRLVQKNAKLDLKNKEGQWVFNENSKMKVDQNKVRELLGSLRNTRAIEILSEGNPSSELLKKTSLNFPDITFETRVKEKDWKLQIDQDKSGLVYARISDPQWIVRLDVAALDKFKQASFANWRDHQFPFVWKKTDISSIELKDKLKTSHFVFKNDHWTLDPENLNFRINENFLRLLPDKIQKFQVTHFLSSNEKLIPDFQIQFKDLQGQVIFEMEWTELKKIKVDGTEMNLHLVKTNLADEVLTLEETSIKQLQLDQIIQSLKPTSSPNSSEILDSVKNSKTKKEISE